MFFRFVTNHAFDRQTDGQTDRILITRLRLHLLLLLHNLYSANFEDWVGGTCIVRWRTWL